MIGCACAVCASRERADKRLRTAAMLTMNGKNIVIDSGPDFRQQMLREKVQDIEAILFTHEHNDHTIGLDDVRPFNFKYEKKSREKEVLDKIKDMNVHLVRARYVREKLKILKLLNYVSENGHTLISWSASAGK